jgi:hypothetical protein
MDDVYSSKYDKLLQCDVQLKDAHVFGLNAPRYIRRVFTSDGTATFKQAHPEYRIRYPGMRRDRCLRPAVAPSQGRRDIQTSKVGHRMSRIVKRAEE